MVFRALGSIGIGLVWGWLIGSLRLRQTSLWRSVPLVGLSSLFLALLVVYFLDWYGLAYFAGALMLAALLHVGWRRQLCEP
jgi:hypothetical protein